MHVYPTKSSRFESADFASVLIDDIGCNRRHQCPRCEQNHVDISWGMLYDNFELGPLSSTWLNFNHNMDKYSHTLQSVGKIT